MMKVEIQNVDEVYTRVVTPAGGSSHVILPKSCTGRRVKVVVMQETD